MRRVVTPAGKTLPVAAPKPAEPTGPELVPARCGHALAEDQGRRKHATRNCRNCIAKRNAAEAEQARINEIERTRLPDGSRFEVGYDAAAVRWTGRLVTTVDGQATVFHDEARKVFALLRKLDRAYRKATNPKPAPAVGGA